MARRTFNLPIIIERRVIVGEVTDDGAPIQIQTPLEAAGALAMRAVAEYLLDANSHDTLVFEHGDHEFTLSAAPLRAGSDDVRDRLGAH